MRFNPALPGRQRGLTFWGLLFLAFVFGCFILFGFKTIPVYLNQLTVAADVRKVARSGDFNPDDPQGIIRALQRQWDIDYIKYLDPSESHVDNTANGHALQYDYEVRQHLFYNIDLVMEFQDTIPIDSGPG